MSSDESKPWDSRGSTEGAGRAGGGLETRFRISLATSFRASSTDVQEVIALAAQRDNLKLTEARLFP